MMALQTGSPGAAQFIQPKQLRKEFLSFNVVLCVCMFLLGLRVQVPFAVNRLYFDLLFWLAAEV